MRIQSVAVAPGRDTVALELCDDGTEQGRVVLVDTGPGEPTEVPGLVVRHCRPVWSGDALVLVDAQGRVVAVSRTGAPEILLRPAPGERALPLRLGGRLLVALTRDDRTRLMEPDGTTVALLPRVRSISSADGVALAVTDRELLLLRGPGAHVAGRLSLDALDGVPVHAQATPLGGVLHVVRGGHSAVVRLADAAGRLGPVGSVAVSSADHVHTVTGLAWADGTAWVRVEAPAVPPRVVTVDELSAPVPGRAGSRLVPVVADDGAAVELVVTGDPGGPVLVEVYGGFGLVDLPVFEPSVAAWRALGGLHVTARLRGGGGAGTEWHRSGQGAAKSRTVADAVAVVRELTRSGLAAPGRTVLAGASLGGLVAASAALAVPGLVAGVACTAAPLDPHRFAEHPAGHHWEQELGDPDDPAVAAAMDDYSPFQRARRHPGTGWPRFLLTTFAEDSRVDRGSSDRLAALLSARGARVVRRHLPRMGHGSNLLDDVHDFSASVLDFALDSTGAP
ncbi:prolyl oligopeptidase family serine peptidase [Xylanimonas oleitrophica]|uniref:prolyl oligopeptidase family serine peptidase n=1 Tax=Xylanimonas oleitrophica TaxID=2607479 RepID=UPI0015CF8B48|nr:prolyl oligopeptidase family serine peptidase [Xylanimonas oleitrophica]